MRSLSHFVAIGLFLSVCPLFADDICSAPPKAPYNPYSCTGEGPNSFNPYSQWESDSHTYNPYTRTLSPYSGDAEPNGNIFHEPKKPGDEPGHWERDDFKVTNWGSDRLYLKASVSAYITNGKGQPTAFGQYIEIDNANKAPIYFGLTTSVLNDKVMPGQHKTINLMIEQPKTGPKHEVTQIINVKYWVSTGVAPTSQPCKTWHDFYVAAAKNQAIYDANRQVFALRTYTLSFRGGTSGSDSQFAGPVKITFTYSLHQYLVSWTNTGGTLAFFRCDQDTKFVSYEPGETRSKTAQGNPNHKGWNPDQFDCQVAIAPADH
jgi:hypothetical protein